MTGITPLCRWIVSTATVCDLARNTKRLPWWLFPVGNHHECKHFLRSQQCPSLCRKLNALHRCSLLWISFGTNPLIGPLQCYLVSPTRTAGDEELSVIFTFTSLYLLLPSYYIWHWLCLFHRILKREKGVCVFWPNSMIIYLFFCLFSNVYHFTHELE